MTDVELADPQPKPRWRLDKLAFATALLALSATLALTYSPMVSWFSQLQQSREIAQYQRALAAGEIARPNYAEPPEIRDAAAYNSALSAGAVLDSFSSVARGVGSAEGSEFVYHDLLNTGDNGLMARVQIPTIDVDLPVYHGTDDETLLKGVGHLQGTSLPVGGQGTRTVLTAHRGLATATMFTDLDKVKEGDIFTIAVLNRVYAYRVFETRVIAPDETEVLTADPARDLATLITCTPLGINTHRIAVTGERVTPTPDEVADVALSAPALPHFPWWAVIQGGMLMLAVAWVWWNGRQKKGGKRENLPPRDE
ncbi:class C sortase [Trueperella pyogenes]|uniref:class C sortase n=1 Tax=Trueperella pyogenes TaxID=1661 RepID=UPI00312B870C